MCWAEVARPQLRCWAVGKVLAALFTAEWQILSYQLDPRDTLSNVSQSGFHWTPAHQLFEKSGVARSKCQKDFRPYMSLFLGIPV